ncbi:MAG: hypothetical protein JWQ96_1064 [Segetibacter sp.]|nr:hypothetical protein [Segetibacter sp.]
MFFNFLFEDELHSAQLVIKTDIGVKKLYVFLADNLQQRYNDSFRFSFSSNEGLQHLPYAKQTTHAGLVAGLQRGLEEKIVEI